jgi:predicted ATP-grasp superfamily ATP-dependent carboligase
MSLSQIVFSDQPELSHPLLILAFSGWTDAGRAASLAVQHLTTSFGATTFAEIDPDEFYDFTATRPWVALDGRGQRRLTWPSNTFYAHHDPNGVLDAILFVGTEPGLKWRVYSQAIVEVAKAFDVRQAVALGAIYGGVSHRGPVPMIGWGSTPEMQAKLKALDVESATYEGPTGVVTSVLFALADAGIPAAGFWAALPSYLGNTPNPKGALALVDVLSRGFGVEAIQDDLVLTSEEFERNVNAAIKKAKENPGTVTFEIPEPGTSASSAPEVQSATPPELPTGAEAISDIEEFLRQSRDG